MPEKKCIYTVEKKEPKEHHNDISLITFRKKKKFIT